MQYHQGPGFHYVVSSQPLCFWHHPQGFTLISWLAPHRSKMAAQVQTSSSSIHQHFLRSRDGFLFFLSAPSWIMFSLALCTPASLDYFKLITFFIPISYQSTWVSMVHIPPPLHWLTHTLISSPSVVSWQVSVPVICSQYIVCSLSWQYYSYSHLISICLFYNKETMSGLFYHGPQHQASVWTVGT